MLGKAMLVIEPSSTAIAITMDCAMLAHRRRPGGSPSIVSLIKSSQLSSL
jgi:hypothetical protein